MESSAWREARLSTHFVDEHTELLGEELVSSAEVAAVAASPVAGAKPRKFADRRVCLANPAAQGDEFYRVTDSWQV